MFHLRLQTIAADRVTYGCPATTPPPEVTVRLMPSRSRGNARSIRAAAGAAAINVKTRSVRTSRLMRGIFRGRARIPWRRGANSLPAARSSDGSANLSHHGACSSMARIRRVAGVRLDDDDVRRGAGDL